MKKILFTLLSALALFSSCSSDNDTFTENVSDSNNEPKFTVNFDIKSDAFEVDKTPLRSSIENSRFLQMVIYKESGEVYSDSVYQPEALSSMVNAEGNVGLSIELPAGNYHLAFLSVTQINAIITETFQLYPKNFYTDYFYNGNPSMSSSSNRYVYYETIDVEVPNTNGKNAIPIELKPMWSEVELSLKDIIAAKKPHDTDFVIVNILPSYRGFSIQSKLATQVDDIIGIVNGGVSRYGVSVNVDSATFTYYVTKAVENTMGLHIQYVKLGGDLQRYVILGSQDFMFDQMLENGYRYKIAGSLPNVGWQNHTFSITLNQLNGESIEVPFE